jgi:hypothetical protein
MSPIVEEFMRRLNAQDDFEWYLVGFIGKVPDRWLFVCEVIQEPQARHVILQQWHHLKPVAKLYAVSALQRIDPQEAAAYWSELFTIHKRIRYIHCDIVEQSSVSAVARELYADWTLPEGKTALELMSKDHPALKPLLGDNPR